MEETTMATSNSKSGTNQMEVPEAKDAMKRFKEEVASELGVQLKDGYNGDGPQDDQEAGGADEIISSLLPKKRQGISGCCWCA